MWGMAEHWWYTRDREWMAKAAPGMVKACEWVIRERQATMTTNPDGSKPLEYGWLPAGSLEDVTDFWNWLATNSATVWGFRALADALADFGHPEGKRLQEEAQAYYDDFMRGITESRILCPVVRLRDGTYVPKIPSRPHERGRAYGWIREMLEGSMFLPAYGLLAPTAPETRWILKDYEDNLYISDRYGYSIPVFDAFWFSRGGFSMQANLLDGPLPYLWRDEVKHFLRAYFNGFASAFYPEIRMCNEHSLPELGYPAGDHFKTSDEAQSTYWLRLMFVNEQGHDLYLGQAIPRYWLADGNKIGIQRAATHFGPLSLRYDSQAAQGTIKVTPRPAGAAISPGSFTSGFATRRPSRSRPFLSTASPTTTSTGTRNGSSCPAPSGAGRRLWRCISRSRGPSEENQMRTARIAVGFVLLLSASIRARDAGEWTIYVTNDNCPDYTWGLTEEQTRQAFADIVRAHLDEMNRTDGWEPANQDRYNMAVTQEAICFVERYPERQAELVRRIKEGRVLVSPFLCNSLWAFQSTECAIRVLYPARRLERDWGIPIDVAEHIEEPSLPWGMAPILAGAGIRWLSVPFYNYDSTFQQLKNPPLFVWEGPDGSRLQVIMDPWASNRASYTQGAAVLKKTGEHRERVAAALQRPWSRLSAARHSGQRHARRHCAAQWRPGPGICTTPSGTTTPAAVRTRSSSTPRWRSSARRWTGYRPSSPSFPPCAAASGIPGTCGPFRWRSTSRTCGRRRGTTWPPRRCSPSRPGIGRSCAMQRERTASGPNGAGPCSAITPGTAPTSRTSGITPTCGEIGARNSQVLAPSCGTRAGPRPG